MNITIINDCRDDNAVARQTTRTSSYFNAPVSFVGVKNDIEAAGNLIDIIDAYGTKSGVILVNVAPRNGNAKKWSNGTPFGYFWINNLLIVSSVDGYTLSLVKKFNLADTINVMDIPTVMEELVHKEEITSELADYIINTQFRSFDFLPRIAAYLWDKKEVVSEKNVITEFTDLPPAVWWTDNFGNCKTTVLLEELDQLLNKKSIPNLKHFRQLKEVPDGELACIVGSSGYKSRRFLEIVIQGDSAANKLALSGGQLIS